MKLSTIQRDRAIGAVIGSAAGDALGAPYEFNPPIATDKEVVMQGGGSFGWEPGEWTDDTSMAIPVLNELAKGNSLTNEETQSAIVAAWVEWAKSAPDVGLQTRRILGSLKDSSRGSAREASEALHVSTGRTAGNGSLMRTGPVALGSLDSAEQTASNARELSELTHWDDDAGDACVLWSLAIRHAIVDGQLDVRSGIGYLPEARRNRWLDLIQEAEEREPSYFAHNGWVIHAFQVAWSAIYRAASAPSETFKFEAERFAYGLELAVRGGYDTDTTAAIAGSLLGAYYGFTAIPADWRMKLHGWPGIREVDLVRKTNTALNGGEQGIWPNINHFDYGHWQDRFELVKHPLDDGVYVGGVGMLDQLPEDVTAVVSLCRVGTRDVPDRITRSLEVMLLDEPGPYKNLNLAYTFVNIANAVKALRDEGHVVFLHCVQSQSRTPSVAAAYSMRYFGRDATTALEEIRQVLPQGRPIQYFVDALNEVQG